LDLLPPKSFAALNRTNPCELIEEGDNIVSARCDIRYVNVWTLVGDYETVSELFYYPEELDVDYDWFFLDTESFNEYVNLTRTNRTAAEAYDFYLNEDCYCDDLEYGDADETFYTGPECSLMCDSTYVKGAATLVFIPSEVPATSNSRTNSSSRSPPSPNLYYLDRYVSNII
jgi:hypothetical protein